MRALRARINVSVIYLVFSGITLKLCTISVLKEHSVRETGSMAVGRNEKLCFEFIPLCYRNAHDLCAPYTRPGSYTYKLKLNALVLVCIAPVHYVPLSLSECAGARLCARGIFTQRYTQLESNIAESPKFG